MNKTSTANHYAGRDETPVRMIVVDMDGTLLGVDGKVSPRTLAAISPAGGGVPAGSAVSCAIAGGRRGRGAGDR